MFSSFLEKQIRASNSVGFVRHSSCDVEYIYAQTFSVGKSLGIPVYCWDCVYGVRLITATSDAGWAYSQPSEDSGIPTPEPGLDGALAVFQWLADDTNATSGIWIFSDIPNLLEKESHDQDRIILISLLTDLCLHMQRCDRFAILTSVAAGVPQELSAGAWEYLSVLPDSDEVGELLRSQITAIITDINEAQEDRTFEVSFSAQEWQKMERAATGLDRQTILRAIKEALIESLAPHPGGKLNDIIQPVVATLTEYKIKKLTSLGAEIVPDPKCTVGGLQGIKKYLRRNIGAGIVPSSILLTGLPGCGKSLVASQLGALLSVPLIRFNVSALFNKYVGETERSFREFSEVIEASAPVVVFVDEIEKAFAQQDNDSVGKRLLGEFLTWLQNKPANVTVVATANEIRGLPPEMLRTGRFDKKFFVDLPTEDERMEILEIQLKRIPSSQRFQHLDLECRDVDIAALASQTEGCNGSDLEALITEACIIAAVDQEQKINEDAIAEALEDLIPYGSQNKEQVANLREWAKSNAVRANSRSQPQSATKTKAAQKATLRI